MKNKLYSLFIKRVPIDVEEREQATETEEIKLLNVFLAVFIVWLVAGGALFSYDERGTFGDMFGSINTIFSGLAFGGIIYTIYQQRAEFRLQREELRLQRKEVAKTNQALDEQVKTANTQRFENTFFQLISMHQEIINNVDTGKPNNKKGKLYIADLSRRAIGAAVKDSAGKITITSAKDEFIMLLVTEAPTALSYYSHILNTVRFIHDSTVLSIEEKYRYMQFYKAILSVDEVKTIYLYYVSNSQVIKFFEEADFLNLGNVQRMFGDEVNIYA